ncbi:MAG: hypothetical protein U1E05_07805 [Patescibacteria group bacterium]|nr:hypothetical protein [Patescibacteria group bacterium]
MVQRAMAKLMIVLALGLPCGGCGGESGPVRYDVVGEVTFNGEPVPMGRLLFTPDTGAGNRNPQGFTHILNGRFATSEGTEAKGVGSGAYLLEVHGYDGVPFEGAEGMVADGKTLFPPLRTTINMPAANCTMAIDVSMSTGAPRVEVKISE